MFWVKIWTDKVVVSYQPILHTRVGVGAFPQQKPVAEWFTRFIIICMVRNSAHAVNDRGTYPHWTIISIRCDETLNGDGQGFWS